MHAGAIHISGGTTYIFGGGSSAPNKTGQLKYRYVGLLPRNAVFLKRTKHDGETWVVGGRSIGYVAVLNPLTAQPLPTNRDQLFSFAFDFALLATARKNIECYLSLKKANI